ncbi:MAG: hypothetical protein ACI9OE_001063 [Mariniflexile sp.]|jgi:hypothetical protein
MYKSKILLGLVFLFYALSVIFQFIGYSDVANSFKSFILPMVTVFCFLNFNHKTLFFSLFLVFYSISDLLSFIQPYTSHNVDYFLGNSLYIMAYTCLILEICKSVCLFHVLRNYKIHILVLTVLNIYIVYVLQVIINSVIAETSEYYVELTYNIVMFLLLSMALINYFYRDNLKSLYLFLGSLCLVFGEVIWVAYTYISERNLLNVLSTTLFVIAIYFFYKQSLLIHEDREEAHMLIN